MNQSLHELLARADAVLSHIEALLPQPLAAPDWGTGCIAWRYRKRAGRDSALEPVHHIAAIPFDKLQNIDTQKEKIQRNTRQFVEGRPANNVLLTGARGTGKSSLIKACLVEYAAQGLRLIEVDKSDLADIADIVEIVAARSERFIVFCDDLSFENGEFSYKALKSVLDGSIAAAFPNVLIYATSNRRHLLPEHMTDNLAYQRDEDGEMHPGEVVEEKISLSERFGLWISFYSFSQDEYIALVAHWLASFGFFGSHIDAARPLALIWSLERGSRSGRVAYQFARDYAGRYSE